MSLNAKLAAVLSSMPFRAIADRVATKVTDDTTTSYRSRGKNIALSVALSGTTKLPNRVQELGSWWQQIVWQSVRLSLLLEEDFHSAGERTALRILGERDWAIPSAIAKAERRFLGNWPTTRSRKDLLALWSKRVEFDCRDELRRVARDRPVSEPTERSVTDTDALEVDELRLQLSDAIASLSLHQQTIIRLRFVHELLNHEIAELLGSTDASVRSAYSQAMSRLRSLLRGTELDPGQGDDNVKRPSTG